MNIGEVIKDRLKQKEITQTELAELLKVTPQAVSRWEMGKSTASVFSQKQVCMDFPSSCHFFRAPSFTVCVKYSKTNSHTSPPAGSEAPSPSPWTARRHTQSGCGN